MKNEKLLSELLIEIKNGDYGNFDVLLEMYRPLIESAVNIHNSVLDSEDMEVIHVNEFLHSKIPDVLIMPYLDYIVHTVDVSDDYFCIGVAKT